MIGQVYLNGMNVYGNKPWDIEGFDEAISSEEMYVPHHVLEWKYSVEELKQMNRYNKVNADELIWMSANLHNTDKFIHKGKDYSYLKGNTHTKGRKIKHKPRTEFNKKFREHYLMVMSDDPKLYDRERAYCKRHGHCSWEE